MTGPTGWLVVGGGITGLAAAWELSASGKPVTVVEAADRFGGKVHTERVDGYLVEHGPDSVVSYRPAALQLAGELGLGDQVIKVREPRSVHLRVAGRMQPMPATMGLVLPTKLGPFARTRILSWPQKARAATDLVRPRVLGDTDMAIGELLRRRLGSGVVTRLADPLLGGVYGASVDELSIDAVLPSLRQYEAEHRSLMLASLAQGRRARGHGGAGSPFRSLRDGMGSLVSALVRALSDRGVELLTGVAVTGLATGSGGATVELSSGAREVAGVVLAGGAASTSALLGPLAPGASRELSAIPLGSTVGVSLGYDLGAFSAPPIGHGYLEAGPQAAPISGVTIASNKWPGRAPEGKVLVRAFVPDRVGELVWADDDELVEQVTGHLGEVLGVSGRPELQVITRWPHCMPKYLVGHRERVAAIQRQLQDQPRLGIAGSALNGVGVPDCVADGRAVARQLRDRVG